MRQYDMENEQPEQKNKIESYQWHEVFYAILMQPKLETFQRLLQDPQAKAQRAYLWMLLPSMMWGMAAFVAGDLEFVTIVLLGISIGWIIRLIYFIVIGWIMQRIAVFFGGNKTAYGDFHSARGMYMPVLVVASALVSLLIDPESGAVVFILSALLMIESILTAIALKAVNDFSWRQSIMVVMTWYLLTAVLFAGLGLF
jgi:hypothetical protein